MAKDRSLRVYYGPDDQRSVPLSKLESTGSTVEVPLQLLLDSVISARVRGLAWADDFHEERVSISTDLFEVISAYRELKSA